MGKDVILFGVVMSSSVYTDNKRRYLIIGKGPAQGLDDATLAAETQFQFIFQN